MRQASMETLTLGGLECQVRRAKAGAPILVALHGRGASSDDLAPLGELVAPDHAWVFPDAPRAWPKDGPTYGRCWYDSGPERKQEIAESRAMLSAALAEARAALGGGPIVLMGFSQGALMTLDTGLREPSPAALLIALSGYLEEDLGGRESPPTLVVHGSEDDVVPVEKGRDAHARLEARGVPVTYMEVPMAHEITPAVVRRVAAFIRDGGARGEAAR
jgi:phospholipase/carboxylesterase